MRIRSLVLSFTTALLVAAPASATSPAAIPTRPAIPPPETVVQVVRLSGPGGVRGAGFMDYTDDSCMSCDGKVVAGLTPGARYRIAGSSDPCGTPYRKATRVYAYGFTASARGTYWNPGRAVQQSGATLPVSVRVLKGSTGTTEVACGTAIDLTDQTGHPLADRRLVLATFDGAARRGIAWALARPDGRTDLVAVFVDVPGDGPLRLRATTGPCSMTGAALFTRALSVTPRHTAARTETVDANETVSVADVGSMQLGAAATPFQRIGCRAVTGLATIP